MFVDFTMFDGTTVSINIDNIHYLWMHPDEPGVTKIGFGPPNQPNIEVAHKISTVKRRITAARKKAE